MKQPPGFVLPPPTPGTPRGALVLAASAAALLSLASCAPRGGSSAASSPAPVPAAPASSAAAASEKPKAADSDERSLADLPEAVARLERLRESVDRISAPDAEFQKAVDQLETSRQGLGKVRGGLLKLPVDELRELDRVLGTSEKWISSKDDVIASRLRRIERRLVRVAELRREMTDLAALAEEESAPQGMRDRTAASLALLDDLERRLVALRSEVLVAVDKLAEVRGNSAAALAETEGRLESARGTSDQLSHEPIWRLNVAGWSAVEEAGKRLRRDAARVLLFAEENAAQFLFVSVLVFGATLALLSRLRRREGGLEVDGDDAVNAAAAAASRIRQVSWVAAIPPTVILVVLTAPAAPPAFYDLALLPAAPAAAWIVVKILGPGIWRTVWVLAASLAVLPLRGALEFFPVLGRLVFLLQTVPLAVVLVLDFRAPRWREGIAGTRLPRALRKVAWLLSAALAAAAVGTIGGWLRLANRLGLGALGTLAGMVLAAATYLVLVEVLRAAVASEAAQALLSVRHHAGDVLAFGLKALRFAALVSCTLIAIVSFELLGPLVQSLQRLLRSDVSLGTMSISLGGILSAAIVLWATFVLVRVVSFVLTREVLPRLTLARGMAFAVSVTTRYLLLLMGFVLAAGAAGIDLTKVGFLAGALGVGLGFGLQNIVSNFISGLILLFERPIQVGDTVDIAGTVGSVTDIGIRASTVRSADGAEVVVPNADLITKPLINWTLTDSHRRFDVGVGVAYGSALEGTAQALLAAASRTQGVVPAPAPEAFLQSFGASSLDWTLRVWIALAEAPRVLSDLKRAVSEELDRARIEVPFPQLDLRVRSVSPEAREALPGAPK